MLHCGNARSCCNASLTLNAPSLLEAGTTKRFEVLEDSGEWIVRSGGRELARFQDQDAALHHVAERLRDADSSAPASISVRYQARGN